MATKDITKLTKKYSPREITTAVKVLVDVLALQQEGDFKTIDPKDEFTPAQIKRLQKQLTEHRKGKSAHLSLSQVSNALGL
jgi:hypothetical protein